MEAMMRQFPVRGLGKEESSPSSRDDVSSSSPSTDHFIDAPFDTVDVTTTQLWFQAQLGSRNGFLEWSQEDSKVENEPWPYQFGYYTGTSDVWTQGSADYKPDNSAILSAQSFNPVSANGLSSVTVPQYLSPYQQSPPQLRNGQTYISTSNLGGILENARPASISPFNAETQHESLDSDWMGFSPRTSATNASRHASDTTPNVLSASLALDWSMNNQTTSETTISREAETLPLPKRRHVSPGPPPAKKSRQAASEAELAEYVGVFENAPGALTTVKKRKKLDGAVRKAAQDVRKAGACHQCRFRKRTCSTGTPCTSCLKNGRGLHELKCQRESPFTSKCTHPYFEHSSTKRCLSFHILLPQQSSSSPDACFVTIDGIGRISHTLKLPACARSLDSFNPTEKSAIRKTQGTKKTVMDRDGENPSVLVLEDHETLGTEVEQWAVEYASKFVHAAGPKFYPTTAAVILGTAYVKKGLPESELVAAMLRAASIAFILRAGVKYTPSKGQFTSQYRTIQASIDTILYQRLKLAEKDLYKMLQRIVFRSLGYLAREQIYPVALVFWQLLRMLCLSSSHLSNIAQRFKSICMSFSSTYSLLLIA
ncbi:uncharacterized protein PAC_08614 [Phialocephala subalpina]|uniref:Zn(2)-C6 fungal-type domain-containing protein n=1 Tax=Phialocephala subalpina TaxID=576137 RepID=A0A1L7X133_9HELO|nr:uncharacterized protein PAC_08614 [Phialocephala subalpina]